MSKLAYEEDIIASLGDISGMHKLLYLTLWSRANVIGHITVNMDSILGMTGIRYHEDDLHKFGNRVVVLDHNEVVLSRYLATTIGSFSPASRPQSRMWEMLKMRYGATPSNLDPFLIQWEEWGICMFAPELPDEYHGEHNLSPKIIKYRNDLKSCLSVDTPPGWSQRITDEFRRFVEYRVERGLLQTSKSDRNAHMLLPSQVMAFQAIVQEMLNDGMSERAIVRRIQFPSQNNVLAITLPPKNETSRHTD